MTCRLKSETITEKNLMYEQMQEQILSVPCFA